MGKVARFINDVYEGIYYYTIKYESAEEAKSSLRLRMVVIFYLYYFSFLLLLATIRIKIYGTTKLNYLEGGLIMIGIYYFLYRYFIEASLVISSFDDLPEERQRKVRLCFYVFAGSIFSLVVTCGLISYFMPKK